MGDTREDRITWMATWAAKNGCQLVLEGECGFGRECVGITKDGNYPDYADEDWREPDGMPYIEHAYHKHPCVAVLGRGEGAEAELFKWLTWFDENGYTVRSEPRELPRDGTAMIGILLGKHLAVRMVKK